MKRLNKPGKIKVIKRLSPCITTTLPVDRVLASQPIFALTGAALILPGLLPAITLAAEDDSVDFQYSHYQEGKRDIYGMVFNDSNNPNGIGPTELPQNLNPIEVDSIHGSAQIGLTDQIKFAFDYLQDTWSGATPIGTAPVVRGGNNPRYLQTPSGLFNTKVITGASPYASEGILFYVDRKANIYSQTINADFSKQPGLLHNQLTHVLSYASPETRQQGDFKLTYEGDNAALSVGGGLSMENDYESYFGSVGGRFDFNQRRTTLNWGASYTQSNTSALLDPDAYRFIRYTDLTDAENIEHTNITISTDETTGETSNVTVTGNREDWAGHLSLSQVLNKEAILTGGLSFTHSSGYLSNPYKLVYFGSFSFDKGNNLSAESGLLGYLESRPGERNQFDWQLGYSQYISPLNAALHFNYHYAHDDWHINAHTFEADWVQTLGVGWTLTPRIRYYSQSAAFFYAPYFISTVDAGTSEIIKPIPAYYSSDYRLSGFGTLSGGITVEKKFAKGVSLEAGFEYYTHQGRLKLGRGGEQDFADFDYWVANAALKVNLAALTMPGSDHTGHAMHPHHSNAPAGVQFDHVLPKAGDFMVGYRYMLNVQAGDFRLGDQMISLDQARKEGCYGEQCAVTPDNMTMDMHMLDLMFAPTDWLTLMLMPQWVDMDMTMTPNPDLQLTGGHGGHGGAVHEHQTGGIGDFGAYSLFKLYGDRHQRVNLALGGTAPTGDVDIVQRKTAINPIYNNPLHYCMQLGSGTWDFKPALTYTGEADKFSWGAQASATIRLKDKNKSGFAFGDIFQGTIWGGYQWTDWLGTSVRGVFTSQGEIRGRYPTIYVPGYDENSNFIPRMPYKDQHIDTFGQPENYGGSYADLGLGINVTVPHGAFAGNSLKFEWLQPVYTNFNGYQPDRDYALNFTWSYGF